MESLTSSPICVSQSQGGPRETLTVWRPNASRKAARRRRDDTILAPARRPVALADSPARRIHFSELFGSETRLEPLLRHMR